jgi:hypothetical protein
VAAFPLLGLFLFIYCYSSLLLLLRSIKRSLRTSMRSGWVTRRRRRSWWGLGSYLLLMTWDVVAAEVGLF